MNRSAVAIHTLLDIYAFPDEVLSNEGLKQCLNAKLVEPQVGQPQIGWMRDWLNHK